VGHVYSYQIAIKSLFWPKCWIALKKRAGEREVTLVSTEHEQLEDERANEIHKMAHDN
jgi:hypothetical protein